MGSLEVKGVRLTTWLLALGATQAMPQASETPLKCSAFVDWGFFCVKYYLCDDDQRIITSGKGILDPRQSDDDPGCLNIGDAIGSECTDILDACCQHPNTSHVPCGVDYNDYNYYEEENRDSEDGPEENPFYDDDYLEDFLFGGSDGGGTPTLSKTRSCGVRNTGGLGGEGEVNELLEVSRGTANFGEWPHVCAVLELMYIGDEGPIPIYQCGASLISDSVILTAGHCVRKFVGQEENITVRCGEWDTQNKNESLKHQELPVLSIKLHPDLDWETHHNNFALLFLEEGFDENLEHISPVCLPKPCSVIKDDQNCVSHGWGKDKFGAQGVYSTKLKEVVVPVVENEKCQKQLRDTRLGPFYELDSSFMCAGGVKDVDTCRGDGGSPLTCRQGREGPWFQTGIVSFGIGCAEEGIPAVYANVAQAACWIDKEVSDFLRVSDSFFGFTEEECASISCQNRITNPSSTDAVDEDYYNILKQDNL